LVHDSHRSGSIAIALTVDRKRIIPYILRVRALYYNGARLEFYGQIIVLKPLLEKGPTEAQPGGPFRIVGAALIIKVGQGEITKP
jgi:hypothetical protein